MCSPRATRATKPARGSRTAPGPGVALQTAAGEAVTVVHLAAEYYPYARSGGLAEAVANLAQFQQAAGMPTAALLPLHRSARETAGPLVPVGEPFPVRLGDTEEEARLLRQADPAPGTRILFVERDAYFDRPKLYGDAQGDYPDNHLRYGFFALAALAALPRLGTGPVLLHAHDWHAALALVYLRTARAGDPSYDAIRTVLSVHNAGYQGHYPPSILAELGLPGELFSWQKLEWYGRVNLLKGGLMFADAVATVSPNHARELRTATGGFGLQDVFTWLGDRFTGILNGIDQRIWDPVTDRQIPANYDADRLENKAACKHEVQRRFGLEEIPGIPLFGMAARLVTQKGIDLILGQPSVLDLRGQFVFLGAGEPRFEQALSSVAAARRGQVAVELGFTDELEHLLMGGADFLLMPCQYEPCGLTQMRAQRYGVLPIVRRVGGLADTVEDGVTGYVFEPYNAESLLGATLRGLDAFANPWECQRMRRNAMARDFSWERSVERYHALYTRALQRPAVR